MKLCFTGDVFLGGDLHQEPSRMKINLPLFNNADKRIINLESPISNNDYVESKSTLFANTDSLGLLKK